MKNEVGINALDKINDLVRAMYKKRKYHSEKSELHKMHKQQKQHFPNCRSYTV